MPNTLTKAIMNRYQLETKYLKTKTQIEITIYKKQKDFCSKLYKRKRKKCYELEDIKNVSDNKEFWKVMKSFLSDKNIIFSQISIEKL